MNLCIFTGRTTKDIELRHTKDGMAVAAFSLAVDTGYGDNKKTSFFNMTAFKASAESLEKYVKKGTKIIVQCEATQNSYTDREGNKRTSVDFIVRNWEFAESKNTQTNTPATSSDGFMNIANGVDEELPFF
jgi:single-strand DNA-binding protein